MLFVVKNGSVEVYSDKLSGQGNCFSSPHDCGDYLWKWSPEKNSNVKVYTRGGECINEHALWYYSWYVNDGHKVKTHRFMEIATLLGIPINCIHFKQRSDLRVDFDNKRIESVQCDPRIVNIKEFARRLNSGKYELPSDLLERLMGVVDQRTAKEFLLNLEISSVKFDQRTLKCEFSARSYSGALTFYLCDKGGPDETKFLRGIAKLYGPEVFLAFLSDPMTELLRGSQRECRSFYNATYADITLDARPIVLTKSKGAVFAVYHDLSTEEGDPEQLRALRYVHSHAFYEASSSLYKHSDDCPSYMSYKVPERIQSFCPSVSGMISIFEIGGSVKNDVDENQLSSCIEIQQVSRKDNIVIFTIPFIDSFADGFRNDASFTNVDSNYLITSPTRTDCKVFLRARTGRQGDSRLVYLVTVHAKINDGSKITVDEVFIEARSCENGTKEWTRSEQNNDRLAVLIPSDLNENNLNSVILCSQRTDK